MMSGRAPWKKVVEAVHEEDGRVVTDYLYHTLSDSFIERALCIPLYSTNFYV